VDTSELVTGDPLPDALASYLDFISKSVDLPITLLGVGTRRRQMVKLS
jgi:adenylosuccinate synthase